MGPTAHPPGSTSRGTHARGQQVGHRPPHVALRGHHRSPRVGARYRSADHEGRPPNWPPRRSTKSVIHRHTMKRGKGENVSFSRGPENSEIFAIVPSRKREPSEKFYRSNLAVTCGARRIKE